MARQARAKAQPLTAVRARTRRGSLQVAVDTWTDRDHGRAVQLVGMVHIGDQAFYDQVAQLVADREAAGTVVHYERIRSDLGDATEVERDLVQRLRAAQTHGLLADLMGAQFQLTAMAYQPHWVNTDVTALQVLRALPDPERFVARCERLADVAVDDDARRALRSTLSVLVRHLPAVTRWTAPMRWGRSARAEDAALVGMRNQVAVDAALSTDRSVVALWGAAHLDGIGAGLQRAGFALTDTMWLTAVEKPRGKHRVPAQPGRRHPISDSVTPTGSSR